MKLLRQPSACCESNMAKRSDISRNRLIQKKIGRNDPCPCGSGEKFKRCHGLSPQLRLAKSTRRTPPRASRAAVTIVLPGPIEKLKKAAINSAGRDCLASCADQSPRNEPATPVSGPPFPARQDLVILDESDIVWQKWFVLTQPNRVRRRANPMSLAESLSAEGGQPCPIPYTHDRLHEVHHWWHEMAHCYHEPEPFRYRIGAFVQAARSVTYMLQKEKGAFDDFDWYVAWVEKAKHDAVLSWINDARTNFVHRQALEPNSWMELRCIGNPRQRPEEENEEDGYGHPLRFKVNPFVCTHEHIGRPWPTDHCHEYERHWEIEGLPGRELLDACADVYDRLDGLVSEATRG